MVGCSKILRCWQDRALIWRKATLGEVKRIKRVCAGKEPTE